MAIANQEMIRDNNRRLVLEYIVNNPPISRAALAKELHLTKATISNIVQELMDQNLVAEIGSARPPWQKADPDGIPEKMRLCLLH